MTENVPQNSEVGYKRPPVEHQYKPGQSGNPGGRPIYKPLTEAYSKLGELDPDDLETYKPKTVWEARAKAMHLSEGVRVAKELADRVEGTAKETIEHQGLDGVFSDVAKRLGQERK